ncbi:MAG: hypothetical protein K2W95_24100 [Candidatus Obscuribacterales bacterium]|nr:hypothetical protein [Candidatus Obscuribacterales bacterium]
MHLRPKNGGLAITCFVALMIGLLPLSAADLCQSRPVKINNAEFVLVASDKFVAGEPAEMELRIKNLSTEKVAFPLFDTVKIELNDKKGMAVSCGGGRRATSMLPPLVVPAGETGVAKFKAYATADSSGVRFNFEDGTGTICVSRAVKPGALRANLTYSNRSTGVKPAVAARIWSGDAATEDVEINLSDGSEAEKPALPGSDGSAAPGFGP